MRQGAIYTGRLETVLDVDLQKFAGWTGGSLHSNTFAIHGRGLGRYSFTRF